MIQMKYLEGLKCLDKLKDDVQKTLMVQQNVEQTESTQRVEESEDVGKSEVEPGHFDLKNVKQEEGVDGSVESKIPTGLGKNINTVFEKVHLNYGFLKIFKSVIFLLFLKTSTRFYFL